MKNRIFVMMVALILTLFQGISFYREVEAASPPGIILTIPPDDQIIGNGDNWIEISGKVWDPDRSEITVHAAIYAGNDVYETYDFRELPRSSEPPPEDNFLLFWDPAPIPDGIYTDILVIAKDSGGATATATYTGRIILDRQAPNTPTAEFDGGYTSGSWTTQPVTVTVRDHGDNGPAGINKIVYRTRLNGTAWSEWKVYTAPVVVTDFGTTDIEAKAIDKAGNESGVLQETVRIESVRLANLEISQGNLNFYPDTLSYDLTLASVNAVKVRPVREFVQAELRLNGAPFEDTGGGWSRDVPLHPGANTVTIDVYSPSGAQRTYTLNIEGIFPAGSSGGGGGDGTSDDNGSEGDSSVCPGRLTLAAGASGKVCLNGDIVIAIPAGATDKKMDIAIEKVPDLPNPAANKNALLSPVFEVSKTVPESFKKTATIMIRFDPSKLNPGHRTAIFRYDKTKQEWVELGGKADGNKITAETDRFGTFAVFAVKETTGIGSCSAKSYREIAFKDIADHWAEADIRRAAARGLVRGYPDQTFRPDNPITRTEFVVMTVRALCLEASDRDWDLPFTDRDKIGEWAKDAVARAVKAGIVKGYEDGSFRPDVPLIRAEMTAILVRALGWQTTPEAATSFADDADLPGWAKRVAAAAAERGLVRGRAGNLFAPSDTATRAEAAVMLLRILEMQPHE